MKTLAVCITLIALSGCTALMLSGGQGANGAAAPGSATAAGDASTSAAVSRSLQADPVVGLYAVDVTTMAGRVTLRGTVGSYAARQRAGEIAAGVATVRAVDNRIAVVRE